MKECFLYAHGGSKNHGCEAIVRGTSKILRYRPTKVYSLQSEEDKIYNLNEIININNQVKSYKKLNLKRIFAAINIRLFNNRRYSERIRYDHLFKENNKDSVAISIGGDNYCYSSFETYEILNEGFNNKGIKTVLWGCSVEPKLIDERMGKDLSNYSLIVARESITYEAVKKVNSNTKLYPDPAFQLEKVELPLPKGFEDGNTIGINLSPLIIECEEKIGATMSNYEQLLDHIIKTTDMQIALIPHVVWANNDDRKPLNELFRKFKDTGRVIVIEDCNCMELKGYIARCRMFIGARTHSTIAAYSTCVPTLVIGYSVKAKGIAKDIFGTYDNYVISVQKLRENNELINAFEWLKNNEQKIRKHLLDFMPNYKRKALDAGKEVFKLIGE